MMPVVSQIQRYREEFWDELDEWLKDKDFVLRFRLK